MRQDVSQPMCDVTGKKEGQISAEHRGQLCQLLKKALCKEEMELPKVRAVPLEQQRQAPPAWLEGEQEMKNLNLEVQIGLQRHSVKKQENLGN